MLLPGGTDPGTTTPPRDVSGPSGHWCDYSGPLDGKRGPGSPWTAGITTFDHPDNEPHPPRWFIMTEPFGFVAANPTWKRVEVLEADETRTWRWGLWVTRERRESHRSTSSISGFWLSSSSSNPARNSLEHTTKKAVP